ncbi:MAG: CPBP family intramembrane metalloprotease [Chlorobi bacterium]|nr:CPBP family intramembrane metalloprotease [Chlorobiota bacterium]
MKNPKIKLALLLWAMGMAGVLSLWTAPPPLDPQTEAILKQLYSDEQIRLLILVNPTLMLTLAVVMGVIGYDRAGYSLPLLEKWAGLRKEMAHVKRIVSAALVGGALAALITAILYRFTAEGLPEADRALSLPVRLLYGGLTEEIIMRFGAMTVMTVLLAKAAGGYKPWVYHAAVWISAFLFAIGHLPAASRWAGELTPDLIFYVLGGNTLAGAIFGLLYYRYGLESAILAHMTAHVFLFGLRYI